MSVPHNRGDEPMSMMMRSNSFNMREPPCYTGTSMSNSAASAYANAVRSMPQPPYSRSVHPPSYGEMPSYTRTASNMMMNGRPRSVYAPPNAAMTRTASNRGLMTPPSYMSTGRNMGMSSYYPNNSSSMMTSRNNATRTPMSVPPPHMRSMQPKLSGSNSMMTRTGSDMMYPNVRAAAQLPRPMYTHN